MKDLLILYPHGLGDCILLTPAIREFYKATVERVHIATLERFRSAKFFENNPYVDKIFYTKDAWHDYSNSQVGFQSLYEEWKSFAKDNNFGGIVMPMHSVPTSKIKLNFNFLGVKGPESVITEIYTTKEDETTAQGVINGLVGDSKFGFVQSTTGVPSKDLPPGFGRQWLQDNRGIEKFIEIGKDFDPLDYNINVQFEILKRSSAVCLPDSVFYHACHALNKEIDYVFFGRGQGVYERVKPLHTVKENVVFKI